MQATGKALRNHTYIQAAAGLVLPMLLDAGARRSARNVLSRLMLRERSYVKAPKVQLRLGLPPRPSQRFQPARRDEAARQEAAPAPNPKSLRLRRLANQRRQQNFVSPEVRLVIAQGSKRPRSRRARQSHIRRV